MISSVTEKDDRWLRMTRKEGLWFRMAKKGVPLGSGWATPPQEELLETATTWVAGQGACHTTSSVTGMGFSWGPLETPVATSSSSLSFLRASAGGRGGGLLGGCLMVAPTCGRSLGLGSIGVHCSPRMAACGIRKRWALGDYRSHPHPDPGLCIPPLPPGDRVGPTLNSIKT